VDGRQVPGQRDQDDEQRRELQSEPRDRAQGCAHAQVDLRGGGGRRAALEPRHPGGADHRSNQAGRERPCRVPAEAGAEPLEHDQVGRVALRQCEREGVCDGDHPEQERPQRRPSPCQLDDDRHEQDDGAVERDRSGRCCGRDADEDVERCRTRACKTHERLGDNGREAEPDRSGGHPDRTGEEGERRHRRGQRRPGRTGAHSDGCSGVRDGERGRAPRAGCDHRDADGHSCENDVGKQP